MQISLFERLIRNDLPMVQLTEQHRMRESFRELLVPSFYETYKSNPKVFTFPNVRGDLPMRYSDTFSTTRYTIPTWVRD